MYKQTGRRCNLTISATYYSYSPIHSLLLSLLLLFIIVVIHGQDVTSYETDDNDLDDNIITTITIQQPNKVPSPRISTFGRELWRDVIVHFACIRPIATGQDNQYYNYTSSSTTTSHYDTYEATTTTTVTVTSTKDHGNPLKHHCCSLFEEALSQVCQQEHHQNGDSSSLGGHRSSILCRQLLHQNSSLVKKEQCLFHAAIVPKVAFVSKMEQTTKIRRKRSTHQLSLDPLVYLSLRTQIPSMGDDWLLGTSSLDIVSDTSMCTGRRDRTPLIQWNNYDTKTTKTSWRRYENAYSPFHVKIHQRNENNEYMAVSLESNLASEEMGMHRSFTHTLSVDISKPLLFSLMEDGSYKIQLQMFQPLSRDVYLDLDEPFPSSGDQSSCRARQTPRNRRLNVINRGTTKDDWFDCKVNLITAPDSVVDIEQPSFASPQHIVAFVIDVALDAKGNDYKEGMKVVWEEEEEEEEDSFQITVTFVTQLHFRYADTVHYGKVGKMGTYSKVHVPTPFLHGARLVTSKVENATTLSEKTIAYNNHYHYGNKIDSSHHHDDDLSTSGSWEIALAEITTGVDDHHDIVIVVTVLASLAGAWRIIHDMSKVSIWK